MNRQFCPRRIFSVPKRSDERNQDNFALRPARGIYAISDGASVSFEAARWSRILVDHYVRQPRLSHDWILTAAAEFETAFDRNAVPWYIQSALDRGSFASLLGIRVMLARSKIHVLSVGDTLALLLDGDRLVETWPYTSADEFDQSPTLISTAPVQNLVWQDPAPSCLRQTTWSICDLSQPRLLCVTDALGQWILSHVGDDISSLARVLACETYKDFNDLIDHERIERRMRRDDTTLLAIW
jgi:hypothetical protein